MEINQDSNQLFTFDLILTTEPESMINLKRNKIKHKMQMNYMSVHTRMSV